MERKVRTEERTRREGEKVKSVMEDDFTEDWKRLLTNQTFSAEPLSHARIIFPLFGDS